MITDHAELYNGDAEQHQGMFLLLFKLEGE